MNILLVGGQAPDTWPKLESFDYYIGIDRGSWYLQQHGLPCDAAIGDFDSLTKAEREGVFAYAAQVKQSPAQKDDTDTQLALLHAFQTDPSAQVTLIGLTGGRIDHFLANLWLPFEPRFAEFCRQITLKDHQNVVTYYQPGTYTVTRLPEMRYLAYCCLTPVEKLTLTKSKYTLDQMDVYYPTSYASNEFIQSEAEFSFATGLIAVIQSKDE